MYTYTPILQHVIWMMCMYSRIFILNYYDHYHHHHHHHHHHHYRYCYTLYMFSGFFISSICVSVPALKRNCQQNCKHTSGFQEHGTSGYFEYPRLQLTHGFPLHQLDFSDRKSKKKGHHF